ncbi:hypothetical protein C5748_16325 [Phyllobacterium phragmitis]|uniref:Uncharacterized protein n=1 Tax=Phyllobacterium phragmitis TaxID=2670329 RepID=A0A2S9IP98_9HYPH|nr:hypothetical protein [Phyllobacterium phragmitis]PRD42359.1 hypothetical protein C5748_16325 [Phyllobacterium phragmitis]
MQTLQAAIDAFNALPPEKQREMTEEQRKSWAEAESVLDRTPANPADKATADLVPVAHLFRYEDSEHGSFEFYDTVPNPPQAFTSRIPLYGPEAAERIAALGQELAEEKRINKQLSDELDMREDEGCMLDDEFRKLTERAETAEACVAKREKENQQFRDRYENWKPMTTPPFEGAHPHTLLCFWTPPTEDEADYWSTGHWDERPDSAAMWCSIVTPIGPRREQIAALIQQEGEQP